MTLRAGVVLAVLSAALLCACSGSGAEPAASPGAGSSPSADARRTVTAQVSGRTLAGHCTGEAGALPPVILESGQGSGQDQLASLEQELAGRTLVCAYDRAGVGGSDQAARLPRSVDAAVEDLTAFAEAAEVPSPYVVVGQSAGANLAFRAAQLAPERVAGFVAMNPVPPATPWLRLARQVQTKDEYAAELAYYRGENEEGFDYTGSGAMLTDPVPAEVPYVVLFDENCDGDSEFCDRVLPPLLKVARQLASAGADGSFVRARGAGHEVFATQPDLVLRVVQQVLETAGPAD